MSCYFSFPFCYSYLCREHFHHLLLTMRQSPHFLRNIAPRSNLQSLLHEGTVLGVLQLCYAVVTWCSSIRNIASLDDIFFVRFNVIGRSNYWLPVSLVIIVSFTAITENDTFSLLPPGELCCNRAIATGHQSWQVWKTSLIHCIQEITSHRCRLCNFEINRVNSW